MDEITLPMQGSRIRFVIGCVIPCAGAVAGSRNLGQALFGSPVSTGLVRNGGLRLCETVPRPAFLWPRGEVTQPTALFLSTPLFSGRNHLLCKDEEPFLLIVSNSDCMCVWFCEKHWLSRDISQWPKSYSVLSVQ